MTGGEAIRAIAQTGATSFAMEAIPRISRAQSMDALSSQANISGYRSALIGAMELGRYFPMLMTAAGTIRPATVLVLGAGVAGLQAIATARRLGAVVQGFDVRAAVKEQVESLGAKFLEFDLGGDLEGAGGYARELTPEQQQRQQELMAEAIGKVDVVITTALVPGRRAPILVTEEAVKLMKPGSVIVDLAGEAGGNCELSEPGQTVIRHDVKILAPLNVPSTLAEHASQLYARNIQALLGLMISEEGQLALDFDDEVIAGACITRDGEIVHEAARAAARPPRRRAPDPDPEEDEREHDYRYRDSCAGGVRRVRGHLEGPEHAAHAVDVGHQRDPRDRAARWAVADARGGGVVRARAAGDRDRVRDDQHRRRVRGHRPDARDVQTQARPARGSRVRGDRGRREVILGTIFLQSATFIDACYIVAFSFFIYGMSGLTGPRTAVRGNKIAAVGMAIAIVATLLTPHVLSGSSTPWLIALGLVIGIAVGLPAARNVRMTAMPQMVALFNGVGGGAVAIIAWVEYRHAFGGVVRAEGRDSVVVRGDRRVDLVLGVEHRVREAPGDPSGPADQAPGAVVHQPGSVRDLRGVSAIVLAAGTHSEALFIIGILLAAAVLGNMVVLPIGGADMPVVISLLNAFTGLSAAATGIALNNTALIVAGMIVGASGTILTNLMAKAMNRSVPAIIAGGFGGAIAAPAGGAGATAAGRSVRPRPRTSRSSSPTPAWS